MDRPHIYIHRIGSWAPRYFTETNQRLLGEFADFADDSALEKVPTDLAARLEKADGILSFNGTGAEEITADLLRKASSVKVASISHWFHGSHDRATNVWRTQGVTILDASDGNNFAVAQWTLGAMISGVFRFAELDRAMRSGEQWPDHHFTSTILDGHRVGLIGLGRIGRLVAGLLKPFNVDLVGYDKYLGPDEACALGVRWMPLDELMRTSTIVSFHVPVTDETRRMISRKHFESIPQDALLVNSARTALLDYDAFVEGLKKGRFRAIVDVFEPEPPPLNDPLRSLPNVVMTPHIAGSTAHMCAVCGRTAIEALRTWFADKV